MKSPLFLAFQDKLCVEDRIVEAVFRILAGDPTLQTAFARQIYRRKVLRPPAEGSPRQLIVAPVYQTEEFKPSRTIAAGLRVGIMMVFEDYALDVEPDEPTPLTVFAHIKQLIVANPTLAVAPSNEPLVREHQWAPMEPVPVYLKPDVVTAYAVGEIVQFAYKVSRDSRAPFGG